MLVFFNLHLPAQQGNFLFECHVATDSFETMSQSVCHAGNCSYDYDDFMDIYMVNENTPIKTIRIKYYIVHYSETEPRNFELSNPDHLAFLEATVAFNENIINNMYIETDQMCQEHKCHEDGYTHSVTDAKLRFDVDYVEVVNAGLWNADTYTSPGSYLISLMANLISGDNTHVAYFLTGSQCLYEKFVLQNNDTCDQPWASFPDLSPWIQFTFWPSYHNFGTYSGIGAPAVFAKYFAHNNGYFCEQYPNSCCPACPESWQLESGLVHELGHVLGLDHTKEIPFTNPTQFYCPTNVMHPAAYRRYLNDVQIAQLHRGMSQTNVRNAVVNCESSIKNLEINRDHTWTYSKKMYQNILVKAPNTLTIKCELQMINNGKIFVEPGARLVVDGGVIAKGCDEFWSGIEVWGNSHLNQWNPANQGKVELKNGAVIEYARNAIALKKTWDISKTGGIVQSNNATFRNNKRSVEFMKYDFNSHSTFINTTFTVDDDFLEGQDFYTHVTLWRVRGVKFYGCRFINDMSDGLFDGGHNKGIFSIDAGYFIHAYCDAPGVYSPPCPQQYFIPSEFSGFSYGVHATTSGSKPTVSIDQATFTNNYFGAVMDKMDGFRVVRSQFEVGDSELEHSFQNDWKQKGLYSLLNSRFTIEDNLFEGTQNGNYSKGLVIDWTGAVSTRSYNNHFEHLYVGQNLVGYNRDKDNAYIGYQSLCNKHHDNVEGEHKHDIWVEKGDAENDAGILMYQGNPLTLRSSGNTFSHTNTNAYSDVWNDVVWGIIYYHTGSNTEPLYVNGNVAKTLVDHAHPCKSNFVSEGFTYDVKYNILSNSERNELLNSFDSLELEFAYLLYNYHQLIDGGSTSDLVAQIQSTWPQEAWDLHDDLMSQSPFLSDEVLIETIDQDVLPHALYLEVCLANPDATSRDEAFLYYIEFEAGNPLPNYMVELIRANSDSITTRTLMEVELASLYAEMSFISELLITDHQLDSLFSQSDIQYWLLRRNQLPDRYALIESLMEEGDPNPVNQAYFDISQDFDLRDYWLDAYNDFGDYLTLWEQIPGSGNTWLDLDGNQLNDLEHMAMDHKGYSQRYAANILCFFYQNCDYIMRDPGQHSARPQAHPKQNVTIEPEQYPLFKIYPNPAENYTSIAWELDALTDHLYLEVMDVTGKGMAIKQINLEQGEWTVDTRSFSSGVYIIRLMSDRKVLQSQSLVIKR